MRPHSKSKLMAYRQCPRRVWLEVHRPKLRENSAAMQKEFAVGHEVGVHRLPSSGRTLSAATPKPSLPLVERPCESDMAKRPDTVETVLLAIELLRRIPRGRKVTAGDLQR
jgi:hypothetical protein